MKEAQGIKSVLQNGGAIAELITRTLMNFCAKLNTYASKSNYLLSPQTLSIKLKDNRTKKKNKKTVKYGKY